MTATPQGSATEKAEQWPANNASGSTRKLVLYGLLALMIAALVYDYLVARPAVSTAYDQITEASVKANRTANSFLSNEDVQTLLGMQPATTFLDGGFHVEVFQWRGGLIVKPHKLFAVYTKNGDKWLFYRHAKFAYDKPLDVSPDRSIVPAPEGDADALEAQYAEEDAGSATPPPRSSSTDSSNSTDSSSRAPRSANAPARPEAEDAPAAEATEEVAPADAPQGGAAE